MGLPTPLSPRFPAPTPPLLPALYRMHKWQPLQHLPTYGMEGSNDALGPRGEVMGWNVVFPSEEGELGRGHRAGPVT